MTTELCNRTIEAYYSFHTMKDRIRPYAWVLLRLPSDITKLQQIEPNTYVTQP